MKKLNYIIKSFANDLLNYTMVINTKKKKKTLKFVENANEI